MPCGPRGAECLGPHLTYCVLLELGISLGSSTLEESFHTFCDLAETPCKVQTKASVTPGHAGFV